MKVHAASVNPVDWHYMRGTPYVMRMDSGFGAPKNPRIGIDFAGTVEAVGPGVTKFKPGDEVFGGKNGALAEYVTIAEDGNLALKPAGISFEQAAAVNVAGAHGTADAARPRRAQARAEGPDQRRLRRRRARSPCRSRSRWAPR